VLDVVDVTDDPVGRAERTHIQDDPVADDGKGRVGVEAGDRTTQLQDVLTLEAEPTLGILDLGTSVGQHDARLDVLEVQDLTIVDEVGPTVDQTETGWLGNDREKETSLGPFDLELVRIDYIHGNSLRPLRPYKGVGPRLRTDLSGVYLSVPGMLVWSRGSNAPIRFLLLQLPALSV